MHKPLAYDVGMHVGANVEYYLAKGYRVIGIEANPELAQGVEARLADTVAAGDLTVLNLAVGDGTGDAPFFVNRRSSVRSTLVEPKALGDDWERVEVLVRPLSKLVREFGEPDFVKIDVEHYDRYILADLMEHGILPQWISVEAHSVEVICLLVAMGYSRFQLVNCRDVGRSVARVSIATADGNSAEFRFQRHSAGPFGDDLPDAWVGAETVLYQWLGRSYLFGKGWFDVHAALPGGR